MTTPKCSENAYKQHAALSSSTMHHCVYLYNYVAAGHSGSDDLTKMTQRRWLTSAYFVTMGPKRCRDVYLIHGAQENSSVDRDCACV